jgi:hypothetical protein
MEPKLPYRYLLYGLTIDSDIAIPEAQDVAHGGRPVDLTIRLAEPLPGNEAIEPEDSPAVRRQPDGTLDMTFARIGHYSVTSSEIVIRPEANAAADLLRLPVIGLVLSAVLVMRGLPALHASALKVGEEAVAFIGDKRFGKSTMAATMVQRGHQLVSDDVVVLDAREPSGWTVRPGPFGIKLWPDAIDSLGIEDAAHYPLYEGATKRTLRTRGRHATTPLPLRRIYVLGRGEQVEVGPITASDGLVELMRNAFMYRYPEAVENASAQLLEKYAPLRRTVDMKILRRPVDKSLLTEVAEAIEADVQLHPTTVT